MATTTQAEPRKDGEPRPSATGSRSAAAATPPPPHLTFLPPAFPQWPAPARSRC